jgi:type II secretory pathway pseudopilin PulG
MGRHRYQAGRSLIEVMVIVSVIAAAGAIALLAAGSMQQKGRRDSAAAEQMHAMHQLIRAATDHVREVQHSFADDAVQVWDVQTLINAGKLPANWQRRFSAVGETPLGQTYEVRALRPSADRSSVRIVVTERGSIQPRAASRLDLPTDANDALNLSYKRQVADLITQRYNELSGVMIAPNPTVGIGQTGNIALDQLIGSSISATAVTVLAGFPELGSRVETCLGGNCDAADGNRYGSCRVVSPNSLTDTRTLSCPTGYENVGSWPYCRGVYENTDDVYATGAGNVLAAPGFSHQAAFLECGGQVAMPLGWNFNGRCLGMGQGLRGATRELPFHTGDKGPDSFIFRGPVMDYTTSFPEATPRSGITYRAIIQNKPFRAVQIPIDRRLVMSIALEGKWIHEYTCASERWVPSGTHSSGFIIVNDMNLRAISPTSPRDILCCQPL